MVTGIERYKPKGDGKRSGGCTQGSMGAMIFGTTESLVETSEANIQKHFEGLPTFKPAYMRMGDQSRVKKEDVFLKFGFKIDKS
jgi:hypothetical protein